MACTITQADLGTQFADVDADLAAEFIEAATEIVLGPEAVQALTELKIRNCGVDPCRMIKLLAQHLITVTPGAGGAGGEVASERVGEVSVTYSTAGSASGLFAGSAYGAMYQLMLARYEKCQAKRRTFPLGVGPSSQS